VYFLPPFHRTAIIGINQLLVNADTLWLRLLGRGKVQERAVREVLDLPRDNAFRGNVLELLISWRVSIEVKNALEEEDREVFMTLSETYLQWKEATRQEARQEGLEQGLERGRQEGKLESIPRLLALGLTPEQIAEALDLDLEQVRRSLPGS
jgi:predicted transposase/invertase (TIGR01784 family)